MLFEPLFAQAKRQPEDLAIIDDTGRYTYRELAASAQSLAGVFTLQTRRPRIGLLLPASAGFVASFYGGVLANKTIVPINFLLGDREISHVIEDSGIDTVVTIPQLAGRLAASRVSLNIVDLTHNARPLPPVVEPQWPSPASDALAVLMYTSGTSGMPKGVLLTYSNIQSNVDAAIQHVGLQNRHRFLGVIPLFHAFGMTATMLAPIQLGATIVYLARFSPVAALNAIREHKISLVMGVPSMFAAIARLKEASATDFAGVYAMISGGEPLPEALYRVFEERFGVTLYEAYGMTEASLAISLNTPQTHKEGSVGKAVPGMQVKIVGEHGDALPSDQAGEVWVRGPMIARGYHNLPDETAATMTSDGWFKTGDIGILDVDGFLHLTGRKKDLIIVAGEKVAPREVEEMLSAHPDVAEAAVIGKPDATRGQVVMAFVMAREGRSPRGDELREFCRQRGLAQWKVPREIRIVPDLPRSATGKVLKRALGEQQQ